MLQPFLSSGLIEIHPVSIFNHLNGWANPAKTTTDDDRQ